jgi:hypothetical protein
VDSLAKKKDLHQKKTRKGSSQHSKTRGTGNQKQSRNNPNSELDTDSGSESDPEDDVPLDALDGSDGGEEDDAEPPFSEQHDFGDDEDVSAEVIIQVMMGGSTTSLDIGKHDDGSLFISKKLLCSGDPRSSESARRTWGSPGAAVCSQVLPEELGASRSGQECREGTREGPKISYKILHRAGLEHTMILILSTT